MLQNFRNVVVNEIPVLVGAVYFIATARTVPIECTRFWGALDSIHGTCPALALVKPLSPVKNTRKVRMGVLVIAAVY